LEKIDRELRFGAPAFDGFDGLCAHLGLAVGRPPVASSFQLSAELPASVVEVFLKDWCELIVGVECLGTPAVMVEWLPGHELQRVEGRWFRSPTCNNCLSIKVPPDAEEARFLLTFEDLQADVSRVKIPQCAQSDWEYLTLEYETSAVPKCLTAEASNREPLADGVSNRTRNDISKMGDRPVNDDVVSRRSIVKQYQDHDTETICERLDWHRIPLPKGELWEAFRDREDNWTAAYKLRPLDEERRRRIRVIIAKDKKA
jgi:hypothetical protein